MFAVGVPRNVLPTSYRLNRVARSSGGSQYMATITRCGMPIIYVSHASPLHASHTGILGFSR